MNDESEDNCDIADGHDVVRTKRRPPPSGVAALCTLCIISESGLIAVYLLTKQRVVSKSFAVLLFGWRKKKSATAATFLSPPPSSALRSINC